MTEEKTKGNKLGGGGPIWINLRNQPSHWIGGAIDMWYVTFSDKRTYVGEYSYLGGGGLYSVPNG